MNNYSIEKVGTDYVVKVDDQQVMKVGSRRRAAKLVVDASELLEEAPLVPVEAAFEAPSIADEAAASQDEAADGAA